MTGKQKQHGYYRVITIWRHFPWKFLYLKVAININYDKNESISQDFLVVTKANGHLKSNSN